MLALVLAWLFTAGVLWWLYRRKRVGHDYYNDVLALGALALAACGFFWRLLFTSQVWMPIGGGDLVSFLYPLYSFSARNLRAGTIPLWNPYLYGGAPFAADNQSGLFYPINLLFFLSQSSLDYRAMELLAVAHVYLAGACAYFGLRFVERRPLKRWAALAGAAAFMFSDLFVTHLGNLNMIACAAWLPLVFCLFRRALDEARPKLAAVSGIFLGFAALAGHVQPLLFIVLALALYFSCHLYGQRRDGWRALARSAVVCLVAFGVAFGVAAPGLLPSFEMSGLTVRADLTYEEASMYSLPPVALVGLLVPGIFGRGPGGYWGPWPRVEVGYVGILPLLLALLAVLLRRDKLTRFMTLLAVVSLFLAMGNASILHGWLYRFVPGFNMVRAPARFIYLLDFALAILAALGLDSLLRPIHRGARRIWAQTLKFLPIALVGTCLATLPLAYAVTVFSQDKAPEVFSRTLSGTGGVVLALLLLGCSVLLLCARQRRWLRRSTLGLLVVGLIVFDLASLGASTEIELNDPTVGFQHAAALSFLKSDTEFYRIDTRTEVWNVWQPDLSLMHDVFDVWGIYNPLVLASFHRYWEGLGSRSTRLYDFLNAKYVIAHKDVVLDWAKFELAFDGDPQVNIYRNTQVLPRAYMVHKALPAADAEQAFAMIHSPDFDPASMVVIQGSIAPTAEGAEPSDVRITSYTNNAITLEASTPAAGYLVLSEVDYPGWRVEVDGRAAELKRANYTFRAVWLPAGSHQVQFRFEPMSWRLGLSLCLLTCFVLAAMGLRSLVRCRAVHRASSA